MAVGVESRGPFLDYRLVDFSMALPDDYKMRQGWSKFLLREAMRGVIPDSIRTRRDKMGFTTPKNHWFTTTNRGEF